MALAKASKQAGVALTVLLVFVFCGPATAQDLPPDILADQYMLEGVDALEDGEGKQAIKAFEKIEALDVEPPALFPFFYGKALVENSAVFDDLFKGHTLLQQFKVDAGRDSEHYDTALRLLSDVGQKLLTIAVAQGRAEAVRVLIASGSNVNASNEEVCTILCLAVQEGHSDIVQVLIDAGADISSRNYKGCTPLCLAVQEGHSDIVQVLIDAGADVSSLEKKDGRETIEAFGKIEALGTELPVLFQFLYGKALIRHSDVSHAEALLKGQSLIKRFVINAGRDSEQYAAALRLLSVAGRRLLFAAVADGQAEAVRAFIDDGAFVDAKDDSGDTLLSKAVDEGHAEIAQALIAAGADVNGRSGDRLLSKAIDEGHAEIAQALIAAGVDVNGRSGDRLLHKAIGEGHAEIAQALIAAGADVNAKDEGRIYKTPLHKAIDEGHAEIAQALIAAGADVNAKDGVGGNTPLHRASWKMPAEIAQALIAAGADVDAKDGSGATPLHDAVRFRVSIDSSCSRDEIVVQALIAAGANVNAKDGVGETPLAQTSVYNTCDGVKRILEAAGAVR